MNDLTPSQTAPITVLRDAARADEILTQGALGFVAALHAKFGLRRHALLMARGKRNARIQDGASFEYPAQSEALRNGVWTSQGAPEALADRRVELIAPADDLEAARASDARIIIADFEDTASPSFAGMIAGQAALRDAAQDTGGPIIMMRPRALHENEQNVIESAAPISASFFDLGLYLFHNAKALSETQQGPFLYIPKIDSADEARLWCDLLTYAENFLGVEAGAIKVTAMIEKLGAAFEMDEIIDAFGSHIIGMSFGADDLTVDFLEKYQNDATRALPDLDQITHDAGFLAAIAARLAKVCHRRGLHAIGGMYAGMDDTEMRAAMQRVIGDGHDGAWVMDAGQYAPARAVWTSAFPEANQLRKPRQDYRITPESMLRAHNGTRSVAGLRRAISFVMEYLSGWLNGKGTVTVEGRVVDMAAAEMARTLLRQWLTLGCEISGPDGAFTLNEDRFAQELQAHIGSLLDQHGAGGFHRAHYASAARILSDGVLSDTSLSVAASPALLALDG